MNSEKDKMMNFEGENSFDQLSEEEQKKLASDDGIKEMEAEIDNMLRDLAPLTEEERVLKRLLEEKQKALAEKTRRFNASVEYLCKLKEFRGGQNGK